MIHNVPLQIMV